MGRSPTSDRAALALYARRRHKELAVPEDTVRARMRWDMPMLSQNGKCAVSLDLPILNCQPTKVCGSVCYASQGRQMFAKAVVKALAVSRMIGEDPDHAARNMVDEAQGRHIRLAGSGDLLPEHSVLVERIDHYGGAWWGFTRRVDTHRALPELMFSTDSATPPAVLEYVLSSVPVRRRAYLRLPEDPPADYEVAVTFPVHGPQTRWAKQVPEGPTDCPVTRKYVAGCWECRRCF